MHLFAGLGLINCLLAVLCVMLSLFSNAIGLSWLGYAGILFLFGVQWILFGLVAEVLMRTYYESQQKKPYVIKTILSKGA